MAAHDVLVHCLLRLRCRWPRLPTGQRKETWDDRLTYVAYGKLLGAAAALRRSPLLLHARLALRDAHAWCLAGYAHQMRTELLYHAEVLGTPSRLCLRGPDRDIGENGRNWRYTEQDLDEIVPDVESFSGFGSDEELIRAAEALGGVDED
jgi:hypothetical protein